MLGEISNNLSSDFGLEIQSSILCGEVYAKMAEVSLLRSAERKQGTG